MVTTIIDKEWSLDEVTGQEWNYVSWTPYSMQALSNYASLSFVYSICWRMTVLSEKDICILFDQIDTSGETGSFYPAANITIMPSRRYRKYSPEQLKQHMDDVKKAQELIKADSIYWDCRFEEAKTAKAMQTVLIIDEYWREKNCFIVINDYYE